MHSQGNLWAASCWARIFRAPVIAPHVLECVVNMFPYCSSRCYYTRGWEKRPAYCMNLRLLKGTLFWICRKHVNNSAIPYHYPRLLLLLSFCFFFLKNKMERGTGWIAIIGVSLYAVIYTIKWQHIETNLWLNGFESQRNSKTPPQAFS